MLKLADHSREIELGPDAAREATRTDRALLEILLLEIKRVEANHAA